MIRLLIDGQEVALPPDFSFTLYEENPVYTKNGQYTYDLSLSLKNFRNARVYGHIDRVNIENGIRYNRSAVLWVDNKIRLNGTEIILGFSDSEVKIQLASGKSELNFLIGGDKSIRDLDLGAAVIEYTPDFQDVVKEWLSKSYPEREWQLLPYYTWDVDLQDMDTRLFVGNNYGITTQEPYGFRFIAYYTYGISAPQPYFCFIINKIIESLGYSIAYNALAEHPILKNAYIVNGIQTRIFAEMLPDWKVKDFFSKIEYLFDLTIVVDEESKTVSVLFKYETIEENNEKQTLIIQDEYDVEEDKDNNLDIRTSNTAYNLDNNEYHKYAYIDKQYYDMCIKVPYTTLDEMRQLIEADDDKKGMKIFTNHIHGDYMAYNNGVTYIPKKINMFSPLYKNKDTKEIDTDLDIIPASMVVTRLHSLNPGSRQVYWVQVPGTSDFDTLDYSRLQTPSPELNPNFVLQDLIEGTSSISKTIPSKIRLAIYSGLKEIDIDMNNSNENIKGLFPISYINPLVEYYPESNIKRSFMDFDDENPFRLNYLYDYICSKFETIDTTMPYKFSFKLEEDFDIRSTFIIRNREFVCQKIEKEVTISGFGKYVLGYFYPKMKK